MTTHGKKGRDESKLALSGTEQFRSLELAGADEGALDRFRDEFPRKDMDELVIEPTDRRNFLGIMSAGMALAGVSLSGCLRKPSEHILPYTRRPEDLVPGKPRYFATAAQVTGSVIGVLVESQEGRPTKIEGNPRHPNSLGATDTFTQAAVLELYDPHRIQEPLVDGKAIPFSHLEKKLERLIADLGKTQGKGLAVLVQDQRSPALHQLVGELRKAYPQLQLYLHDAAAPRNTLAGLAQVGQPSKRPLYDLSRADRILSLDMDFLGLEGDVVRCARHFAWRRRISSARDTMNRLYVVEPAFSVTGTNADHRLRLAPSQIGEFLADFIGYLASKGVNAPSGAEALFTQLAAAYKQREASLSYKSWLEPLRKDLLAHRRRSLVLVGERQPPRVHALAQALNSLLEAHNRTLTLIPSQEFEAGDIAGLARDIAAKRVTTLLTLAGNPLYEAPADLHFDKLFRSVPLTVTLALTGNETTAASKWVIPKSHFLETWGELVATDGSLTIQQPLIDPLYRSLSEIELLARLVERKETGGYELVHGRWAVAMPNKDYLSITWRRSLHDGVRRMRLRPERPTFDWSKISAPKPQPAPTKDRLEVVFALDNKVYDGRFAANPWLQELPDPITKLTWDNAALVGVATAKRLGLRSQQLIELEASGQKIQLPVWVIPGVAENTVVLPLGYGRKNAGKVAENAGFDVKAVRSAKSPHYTQGVALHSNVRGSYKLASTQEHGTMVEPNSGKARPIAIESTLAAYRAYDQKRRPGEPGFAKKAAQVLPDEQLKSIYEESNNRTGQQWGMSIDLTTCIGCNACTIACQAENNIASVGKTEVLNGRELHWIRLDRYFASAKYDKEGEPELDDVTVVTQPLGCQQCETAPCENVCPVGATAHSPEGLNDMAYNRCIGTRYCGNNCPYKVRRFNFFNYTKRQDDTHPLLAMQRNPDVTVRFRGVMEKCTYCVQRINGARIDAKVRGNGVVPDGAIVPACQQVCPTQAIVFGDVANPQSSVSKMKKLSRDYALLGDLNTKPRTTYLAKIRNPNPELV